MFVPYFVVPFFFYHHLELEERAGCFTLFVFLAPCGYYCFVALPRGAVGWSVVCGCSMCGCAGWSTPSLFACNKFRSSRVLPLPC